MGQMAVKYQINVLTLMPHKSRKPNINCRTASQLQRLPKVIGSQSYPYNCYALLKNHSTSPTNLHLPLYKCEVWKTYERCRHQLQSVMKIAYKMRIL